jgi:hypothetical protein
MKTLPHMQLLSKFLLYYGDKQAFNGIKPCMTWHQCHRPCAPWGQAAKHQPPQYHATGNTRTHPMCTQHQRMDATRKNQSSRAAQTQPKHRTTHNQQKTVIPEIGHKPSNLNQTLQNILYSTSSLCVHGHMVMPVLFQLPFKNVQGKHMPDELTPPLLLVATHRTSTTTSAPVTSSATHVTTAEATSKAAPASASIPASTATSSPASAPTPVTPAPVAATPKASGLTLPFPGLAASLLGEAFIPGCLKPVATSCQLLVLLLFAFPLPDLLQPAPIVLNIPLIALLLLL